MAVALAPMGVALGLSLLALGFMALVSPQWAQMTAVALGLAPILAWLNYLRPFQKAL